MEGLEALLKRASLRLSRAIHRRLEALARHPDLEGPVSGVQDLPPGPDRSRTTPRSSPPSSFPAFPFLSEESIEDIANAKIERIRLDALRLRLQRYRNQLSWPAPASLRGQMDGIFSLLETFVRHHPTFYPQVRAELVSWVLHKADPELSEKARGHLDRMVEWFEAYLEETTPDNEPHRWEGKIVFQDRLSEGEVRTLKNGSGRNHLPEAVHHAGL